MTLEKIKKRIIQDAKKDAAGIKRKATAETNKALKEAQKELDEAKKAELEKAKKEAIEEKRRIIARANLDVKDMILTEKRKGIDLVFERAMEEVQTMPEKDYVSLIKKLIIKAASGDEELITNKKDREKIKKHLGDINKELKGSKKKGELRLSKTTRDIPGGFILKSKNLEINYSLSVIFKNLQEDIENDIAKILFG